MRIAITRGISPNFERCEVSHLARRPIDLDLARSQHREYENCLGSLGCSIHGLPADPELPVAKVRKVLPLEDGKPFDYEPYDKAKELLLAVVEDAGYAHAKLDAKVIADRANHEAVIELTYDTGPKCKFGAIDIVGAPPDLVDAVRARGP